MLRDLKDRAQYIVNKRFGLEDGTRHTLESIGKEYGITRERVRQIENFAINAIRKSENFAEARVIFDELKEVLVELGGVVDEKELLDYLTNDPVQQNHIHLYLVLGDDFSHHKEDTHFASRWSIDQRLSETVHEVLRDIHRNLSRDELLSESEILEKILKHDRMTDVDDRHHGTETARRWLNISKAIDQNQLGNWGRASSPNIKTRGVRDHAYLVLRRHGSPLHFREVAQAITEAFGEETHVATCHNELIKDPRFVLVGRGVYALKEWGYKAGVVRDVIKDILESEGPLSKEDVVDRVLKERYLKRNTILVNLQNPKHFVRDENGLYFLAGQ